MEQARGHISAIHDDHVTVEVNTASFCPRCAAGKGCGAGLIGSDSGPRHVDVSLPEHVDLVEGAEVTLELEPQSVLRAAVVVYGVPLLIMAVVSVVAVLLGWSDLVSAAVMVGAGVLGVSVSRRRLQRSNCLKQFTPVIRGQAGAAR